MFLDPNSCMNKSVCWNIRLPHVYSPPDDEITNCSLWFYHKQRTVFRHFEAFFFFYFYRMKLWGGKQLQPDQNLFIYLFIMIELFCLLAPHRRCLTESYFFRMQNILVLLTLSDIKCIFLQKLNCPSKMKRGRGRRARTTLKSSQVFSWLPVVNGFPPLVT